MTMMCTVTSHISHITNIKVKPWCFYTNKFCHGLLCQQLVQKHQLRIKNIYLFISPTTLRSDHRASAILPLFVLDPSCKLSKEVTYPAKLQTRGCCTTWKVVLRLFLRIDRERVIAPSTGHSLLPGSRWASGPLEGIDGSHHRRRTEGANLA